MSTAPRTSRSGQPFPIATLSERLGAMLVEKVRELAAGVGDHAAGFWHTDSVSVHFRWPLLMSEMDALPEGWMASPALDTGGREDEMTKAPPFGSAG